MSSHNSGPHSDAKHGAQINRLQHHDRSRRRQLTDVGGSHSEHAKFRRPEHKVRRLDREPVKTAFEHHFSHTRRDMPDLRQKIRQRQHQIPPYEDGLLGAAPVSVLNAQKDIALQLAVDQGSLVNTASPLATSHYGNELSQMTSSSLNDLMSTVNANHSAALLGDRLASSYATVSTGVANTFSLPARHTSYSSQNATTVAAAQVSHSFDNAARSEIDRTLRLKATIESKVHTVVSYLNRLSERPSNHVGLAKRVAEAEASLTRTRSQLTHINSHLERLQREPSFVTRPGFQPIDEWIRKVNHSLSINRSSDRTSDTRTTGRLPRTVPFKAVGQSKVRRDNVPSGASQNAYRNLRPIQCVESQPASEVVECTAKPISVVTDAVRHNSSEPDRGMSISVLSRRS